MTGIKQGTFKKSLLSVAILAPAMVLTACGSSSSGGGEETFESSGVAYDGYLRGALVCVDENFNKQCDDGEPSATTGEGGKFEITGLTEKQSKLPLVLEAVAGQTIDEDTDEPVENDFVFSAPAGSSTVSAFSTIIQAKKERKIAEGLSVEDAEAEAKRELANELGVDENLDLANYDAVAKKDPNATDGSLAAKLHVINQVLTRNISEALKDPEVAGSSNTSAALLAAVEKVAEKVSVVKTKVDEQEAAVGGSFIGAAPEALESALNNVANDPEAKPDDVTSADLADAEEAADKAQDAIDDAADPGDGTGATGGTGQ